MAISNGDSGGTAPRRRQFRPSAAILASGLALLVVGQFVYNAGVQASLVQALDEPFSGGMSGVLTLIGGLLGLVGSVLAVVGAHRLAANVDLVASDNVRRSELAAKQPGGRE